MEPFWAWRELVVQHWLEIRGFDLKKSWSSEIVARGYESKFYLKLGPLEYEEPNKPLVMAAWEWKRV